MSLRTSFQKLIRRDPTASLRERAADLRARPRLTPPTRGARPAAPPASRFPVTADERNERLGVLIRHELNVNGRPVDAALLAELNAQHGR